MPLQGRVCRLAVAPVPTHIWIGDDILNQALHRWAKRCVGRRHGSAIPGPLEARKRTTKRRIMDLRPVGGGLDLHPGFLTGLDLAQENQQSWQWQPPTHHLPQNVIETWSNDVPLPPWMMEPETAEGEEALSTDNEATVTADDVDVQEAIVVETTNGNLQQRPRPSPVNDILQSEDLDDFRKIIGKIGADKPAVRRKCSIVAFEQLLKYGRDIDTVLEFLGDRVLNQRGARNLTFFVAHCLEVSKVEDMRVLCKWVTRQLYIGRYSDSALLTILQSLSNVRNQDQWQMVLDEFCTCVVEALQLSPVVRVEYLEPKTWSSFVGVLFHDSSSEKMVDTGLNFLKSSSALQLEHLGELIWPIIEHWIHSWNPRRSEDSNPSLLSSKITKMLQLLPLPRLVETVTTISRRLLDMTISKEDFRSLRQQHLLWWSAVRSPEAFPYIRKSDSWREIISALRKREDEDVATMARMAIQKHLEGGNLRAAHREFMRNPQVLLDQCPNLAEALILDSEEHAKAALELSQTRRHKAFSDAQDASESYVLKQLRQDRVDLLERMALAYARMPYTRPSFAFRCVYDCWNIHKQDRLGPIRPGMARALIESGIFRPLQSGRRLVSEARLEWILQQVAEAEGKEVMRKLAAAIWQWREDVIRQMEYQRNTKRRWAIEQQWHEQATVRHGTDRWDILDPSASLGMKASRKRQEHLERPSTDLDSILSLATIGQHSDRVQQREGVSVYRAFPEQVSFSSPKSEVEVESTELDGSLDGFPEIDYSSSTTPEDNVQRSLEEYRTGKETLASPSEIANYATRNLSQEAVERPNVNYRALRIPQQPLPIPTTPRLTNKPDRASPLDTLLERLNSAGRVASFGAVMLDGTLTDELLELPPILPCSLGAAGATDARTADLASGGQEEKEPMIRRVVGTGPNLGGRDAEEPSTLSTAMQPALGSGIAMGLSAGDLEKRDRS